ncbi:MFS transporter [Albimonas sp. CAU 1670]|uniref:MFS transporter n=1 Tax=Albimonas sp. CAU 1670 TaxID=3032599 RepID=UPI0023DA1386|nr:MFS transporter [Albimonas sp. CAU 1670]MDF2233445.1 MFS transporter [Albimonas sp. CAU 1670]
MSEPPRRTEPRADAVRPEAAGHAPRPSGVGAAAAARGPASGAEKAAAGFVLLMAALGAMNAFAVDIVIPALGRIAEGFGIEGESKPQWAILAMFLGMACSQLCLGPVSDRFGRRPAIFVGMGIALAGGLLASLAPGFGWLVVARFLQGFGTGGLRVVSYAIMRDRFSGDEMARVVSLTNSVFVLMVFTAPVVGQVMVEFAHWRWVFAVTALQALGTTIWFALAQPETLAREARRPISPAAVARTFLDMLRIPAMLAAVIAIALVFGAFATFLGSAHAVLGGIYGLEWGLPLAFGCISACFGVVSFANSRLVMTIGAGPLTRRALAAWAISGFGGAAVSAWAFDGVPPLVPFMLWLGPTLALFGILFGNLLSMGLATMGDRAGSASSVLSASGTLCGVALGGLMAEIFDGTVVPLALIIGAAGAVGLVAVRWGKVA